MTSYNKSRNQNVLIVAVLSLLTFFLGRATFNLNLNASNLNIDWYKLAPEIVAGLLGPLVAGLAIWLLGIRESNKKLKQDSIRDLMTFRGDYAAQQFTQSLNKVAIIFHSDDEIRGDIRNLYEVINNPNSQSTTTTRAIVDLIYKLCHKNGFDGLTEYDIDQSFVKATSQNPETSATKITPESPPPKSSAAKNQRNKPIAKKKKVTP